MSFPPHSLWDETAEPAPPTPRLEGDTRCDVAVIGAGFTGLSTAIHLAEQGVDTVVIDAKGPGWGASGRNGGQVIPGFKYDPPELVRMYGPERGEALSDFSGRTADVLFDLVARKGIACDAVRNGWVQGATTRTGLERTKKRVAGWAARGAAVQALDRDAIRTLLGGGRYHGGWIDRRGGHVQPLSLARGLARAALADGARVHGETPATSLARDGAGWRITTPKGAIRAEKVVLGTAAYTDDLWPGLKRSFFWINSLQVSTAPLPPAVGATVLPQHTSVSEARNLVFYYRRDRTGRLVFGGRGPSGDPRGLADFRHLEDGARRMFPQLGDVAFDHHWYGRFASTRDHLPHLHELAPGVLTWLGCNGRGVALATAMGRLIARGLVTGERESLPVPFTRPDAIPLHALRPLHVAAFTRWYAIQDALG